MRVMGLGLLVAVGVGAMEVRGVVEGSAFRMVGEGGKVRATLAAGPEGGAMLTFFDESGKAVRAIGPRDDVPERLARVEAALAALQSHVLLRDRLPGVGAGIVLPERPDVLDDIRRDQTERDVERVQEELRRRQAELERQSDRQRMEMDNLRREQEKWDLQRRQREALKVPPN